ncbi:MAG TPA: PA14 domain-containing protein, partial [Pirellulales bacterium]|nr:PA14 domain-containing protein [Pirellulales bacterium]
PTIAEADRPKEPPNEPPGMGKDKHEDRSKSEINAPPSSVSGPTATSKPSAEGRGASMRSAAGPRVDLLELIVPERDAVHGDWKFEEGGLLTSPLQGARLQVPYAPPVDYALRVAARKQAGGALFLGLVVDGRQTSVAIDGWNGQTSGLHFLDGQPAAFNASKREAPVFTDAEPKEIVCTVHPDRVLVECGAQTIVDWRGDAARLSMEPLFEMPDRGQLFLGSWDGQFLIEKLELTPLPPEPPHPIRQATGEAVDILKRIDIQRDAVRQWWRFEDGALVGSSAGFARLQTQVGFPAEYKLTARVERSDGGDAILFGLSAAGKPFSLILDGQAAQLTNIIGNGQGLRPPSWTGPLLTNKQSVEVEITVLLDRFLATIDGKPLFDWPTDYSSVAANPQPDNPAALSLMVWGSTYRISEWTLTPLSGEAPPDAAIQPLVLAPPREKIPDPAAVREARSKVESKYQNESRQAKKLPERLHIARKIFDDSMFPETVPLRYALLREAAERTAGLGDAALACEALDEVQARFDLDALPEQAEAAREAIAKAHDAHQAWGALLTALSLADRAMRQEQLPLAEQFADLAATAARKSGSLEARSAAERRAEAVRRRRARRSQYDRALARLADSPDDRAANLEAGRYECFFLGQWDRGLVRFEQSPDDALRKIAALERVAETELTQRAPLAEAWRAAAAQAGDSKDEYLLEANYWLQRARATLAADPAELETLERELAPVRGLSMSRLSPGLSAGLFNGGDFQEELARRIDPMIDFNFGFGSPDPALPGDYFSIRWTGWLKPPLAGKYVLRASADDGFRLWLDGRIVLDRWGGAGDEAKEVELTDEPHALRIEYNEYGATAAVRLIWQLRDLTGDHAVPAAALYHDAAGIAAMVESPR